MRQSNFRGPLTSRYTRSWVAVKESKLEETFTIGHKYIQSLVVPYLFFSSLTLSHLQSLLGTSYTTLHFVAITFVFETALLPNLQDVHQDDACRGCGHLPGRCLQHARLLGMFHLIFAGRSNIELTECLCTELLLRQVPGRLRGVSLLRRS